MKYFYLLTSDRVKLKLSDNEYGNGYVEEQKRTPVLTKDQKLEEFSSLKNFLNNLIK